MPEWFGLLVIVLVAFIILKFAKSAFKLFLIIAAIAVIMIYVLPALGIG